MGKKDQIVSAMSESLLARDVYWVCFPERDGTDSLRTELADVRKKFFCGGKHAVKAGQNQVVKGFNGKLRGKLSRHSFTWKKAVERSGDWTTLEEAFDRPGGHLLVRRDFQNAIISRVFFDREHRWIKSEYYEPWDSCHARVTFRPCETADIVERSDREPGSGKKSSAELYPLPYLSGSAEQSLINARFGEPRFIVSTAEGEFCYCPKREAEARKRALDEIKNGTIVLMPAWEVKDGAVSKTEEPEETEQAEAGITFTSLDNYAKIEAADRPEAAEEAPEPETAEPEAAEEAPEPEAAEEAPETEAARPEATEEAPEAETAEPEATEEAPEAEAAEPEATEEAPEAERAELEAAANAVFTAFETAGPSAPVSNDGLSGHRRTEQENGLTVYDGEYQNGRREGFGSYYYKDGALCYAGFWKDGRRDGLGVSFRASDHALHIAKWENGQPGGFVSLFDKDGSLRYGGHVENGKRQGAGVSFCQEDGTIFVGKWENGQPTGLGSAFDPAGNLLYYGGWKDGKRNGHGTEFDRNGNVVFDGDWKDDKYHNGVLYRKLEHSEGSEGGITISPAAKPDPDM